MKTDKELFGELQARNKNVRLFTEAQILDLMGKARQEVINDHKKSIPQMKDLQESFRVIMDGLQNDAEKRACYSRLTQEKLFWVWFTQGAAAVLKRFRNAN